jgi:hypothetical protein
MPRRRTIILLAIGLAVVLATIHFTINGVPELGSLNPHAR